MHLSRKQYKIETGNEMPITLHATYCGLKVPTKEIASFEALLHCKECHQSQIEEFNH